MNDAASRVEMTADLALEFARQRTHGEVFMDGRHNPLPSEMKAAERFMERLEYVGLLAALSSPETTPAPDAGLRAALADANRIIAMMREHLAEDHPDCAYTGLGLLNDASRARLAALSSPETTTAAAHYWVGDHGVADGGNVSSPETTPAGVLDEAALDVERLARALNASVGTLGWLHLTPPNAVDEWRENARIIAIEYARQYAALGRSGSGGGRG